MSRKSITKPSAVAFIVYPPKLRNLSIDNGTIYRIRRVFEQNGLIGFCIYHFPEAEDEKAHYHIMIVRPIRCGFSMDTWHEIARALGAANDHVEILFSPHEYARYLTHRGYSDKYQYSASDVLCFGQIDYESYCSVSDVKSKVQTDPNEILADIIQFCNQYQVDNYADLVDFSLSRSPNWFPVVKSNCNFLKAYMRSVEYKYKSVILKEQRNV